MARNAGEPTYEELTERVSYLERMLARFDPKKLVQQAPTRTSKYAEELCTKVMALAMTGMSLNEIRTELGILKEDWLEWKRLHPEFKVAASMALDVGKSYWHTKARRAMHQKDSRFQYQHVERILRTFDDDDDQAILGDASELIKIDTRDAEAIEADQEDDA